MYLNRRQIEALGIVSLTTGALNDLAKEAKFKAAAADIKRGKTFLLKGFETIYHSLDEADKKQVNKIPDRYKVVLLHRSSPQKDEAIVKVETLSTLAEFAIGNTCVGCERKDWRQCRLRDCLMDSGTPKANELKNDCQYRQ